MDEDLLLPWTTLIAGPGRKSVLINPDNANVQSVCVSLYRQLRRDSRGFHITPEFFKELTIVAVAFVADKNKTAAQFAAHGGYAFGRVSRVSAGTDLFTFVGWRHNETTLVVLQASREDRDKPLQMRDLSLAEFQQMHNAAVLIPHLRVPLPNSSTHPLIAEIMQALRENPVDVSGWAALHDLIEDQGSPVEAYRYTQPTYNKSGSYRKPVTFSLTHTSAGLYAAKCLVYKPATWANPEPVPQSKLKPVTRSI